MSVFYKGSLASVSFSGSHLPGALKLLAKEASTSLGLSVPSTGRTQFQVASERPLSETVTSARLPLPHLFLYYGAQKDRQVASRRAPGGSKR